MSINFIALVGIGISAFIATNIDDIFVLMFFFSNSTFEKGQVIAGQYLGIGLLVAISTLGALLSLVIPLYFIGLLGLVPITIGLIRLVKWSKKDKLIFEQPNQRTSKWHHLSMLTVAAVTFSNGGDNIGIYTPFFAKYNSAIEVVLLIIIFMVMTAIWCAVSYYLVSHPFVARRIRKTGDIIFPFVLIGLGIFILISGLLY
ncbi:MAG: cadmium resistance transporter [Nitrososphaeraceae archaeon]